mmetsp:Transcript_22392/g.39901  ORF Transcript_22392/g.39901 Transcript_22392/m.39901 type:complete len:244 (-) Transcript_22392:67-798(-)
MGRQVCRGVVASLLHREWAADSHRQAGHHVTKGVGRGGGGCAESLESRPWRLASQDAGTACGCGRKARGNAQSPANGDRERPPVGDLQERRRFREGVRPHHGLRGFAHQLRPRHRFRGHGVRGGRARASEALSRGRHDELGPFKLPLQRDLRHPHTSFDHGQHRGNEGPKHWWSRALPHHGGLRGVLPCRRGQFRLRPGSRHHASVHGDRTHRHLCFHRLIEGRRFPRQGAPAAPPPEEPLVP